MTIPEITGHHDPSMGKGATRKPNMRVLTCFLYAATAVSTAGAGSARQLVLVEAGISRAPIIVFENPPPLTRRAADELAYYIEKTSGAKPEVLEGRPDPLPERAIWVGYQPVLTELFPDLDFDFQHPEEILIAANERHLVIAGRDRWDPDHMHVEGDSYRGRNAGLDGVQQEYGTCNAVYTFLQDYLDIRWLWPGPSGEDVIRRKTISFELFEYRYHPQFRARAEIFVWSGLNSFRGVSHDWSRFQRLQLDSLKIPGGHAFSDWHQRLYENRPELFALQPDGTRGSYPHNPKNVSLCKSNPDVWQQWIDDVEEQLRKDPTRTVFNTSPNDAISYGTCVCKECVAMDHPDGAPSALWWNETGQEYVALSDRFVTFANRLAGMLKERYPDNNFDVSLHAYGRSSRPAPVAAVPAENMIITFTGNFTRQGDDAAAEEKREWLDWVGRGTEKMVYRPNMHTGTSGRSVRMSDTIEFFKFFATNKCVGFFFDRVDEHWAIHAPQYYLMAALAWNPEKDGYAILDDYYQRGFGPAAPEVEAYWTLIENANKHSEPYSPQLLEKAGQLLDDAAAKVRDDPKYAERVAFIRAGYDYHRLVAENTAMMTPYLEGGKQDAALGDKMRKNMETIQNIIDTHTDPHAFNPIYASGVVVDSRGRPPRRMQHLHPDFASRPRTGEQAKVLMPVTLETAEDSGWTLAFHDDFQRQELGGDWKVIEGHWKIEDGHLRGGGTLVLDKDFAGEKGLAGQRIEFEATTDVAPVLLIPGKPKPRTIVSDMSSFIQVQSPEQTSNPWMTGYFFQFGGFTGNRNRLIKAGKDLVRVDDPEIRMMPDTTHKIVAENDQGRLRLFVDGVLALEHQDEDPLTLSGQDRIGFYFYTASKVPEVKVYVKHPQ